MNHQATLTRLRPLRKTASRRRGLVLMEAIVSLSIVTVVGLGLLTLSLNLLQPRQSILQQTLTDAYMSYERAFAERIPFDDLTGEDSAWPEYPEVNAETVEIGRLPGGTPVNATVTRTRYADAINAEVSEHTFDESVNPAKIETWRVVSVINYSIGERSYAKARTVIRSQ